MVQRYKFFIASGAIELVQKTADFWPSDMPSDKKIVESMLQMALSLKLDEDIKIHCLDPFTISRSFLSHFKIIQAGGGYVINSQEQLLMIFKRGFWDLPKGKLDIDESLEECAMREVTEECGIRDLVIKTEAYLTWHFYQEKGKVLVKESHWYGMHCYDQNLPIAQIQEGITEVKWTETPVSNEIRLAAYPSIRDVIDYFG